MTDKPRETAYDMHISPLMTQIIALCKEHNIPVVANFELDFNADEGSPCFCTTVLIDKDSHKNMHAMSKAAYPEPQCFAFTIVSGGNK